MVAKKNKNLVLFDVNLNLILKYVLITLTIVGFLVSLYFAFTNLENPYLINVVLILPFILFLTPYLIMSLYEIKSVESKMQVVPRFFRDIVDNVESGMDLISSIKATVTNEYGVLNMDVKKLVNQLSWGVPFEKAILRFAENVGEPGLKRDLLLTIEARKVGGHVEKILRELSLKIQNDNLTKKERKSSLASNTFTGYISFIVFIFVIIIIYNSLFVNMATVTGTGSGTGVSTASSIFLSLLILLSYELAILSGFLFGMMQENSIIAGAPHVVALVISVFIAFMFFIHY